MISGLFRYASARGVLACTRIKLASKCPPTPRLDSMCVTPSLATSAATPSRIQRYKRRDSSRATRPVSSANSRNRRTSRAERASTGRDTPIGVLPQRPLPCDPAASDRTWIAEHEDSHPAHDRRRGLGSRDRRLVTHTGPATGALCSDRRHPAARRLRSHPPRQDHAHFRNPGLDPQVPAAALPARRHRRRQPHRRRPLAALPRRNPTRRQSRLVPRLVCLHGTGNPLACGRVEQCRLDQLRARRLVGAGGRPRPARHRLLANRLARLARKGTPRFRCR